MSKSGLRWADSSDESESEDEFDMQHTGLNDGSINVPTEVSLKAFKFS